MGYKCIVHSCLNHKHQGTFIGDLCMPCHNMLTSGEVKYGETFVHGLRDRIKELEAELHLMKTAGIIEVAIRNPDVSEYMAHWERRAESAEAKLEKAVETLHEISSKSMGEGGCYYTNRRNIARASATLAELKG